MSGVNVEYLIYAAVFIGVILLVEGLYYLLVGSQPGGKAVNRRLRMLSTGEASREVLETLRRHSDSAHGKYGGVPGLAALDELVTQSGMTVTLGRIVVVMVILASSITLLIMAFLPILPFWQAPLVGIPAGVGLPVLFMKFKRNQRIKKLSAQLCDTLDLMVRSLRAGHPMNSALSLVAREMPDPIGTEMGIVVDEMTFGLDFREALENLRQRVPAPDLHYFVVTVNIQHGTGGNLAEVLENLSKVIRARYQMFAKIRAMSAEGRISATILSVLPFLVLAAVWVTTPNYYTSVWGDPALPVIAGIAAAMELTAIGVMWKMVNFRF